MQLVVPEIIAFRQTLQFQYINSVDIISVGIYENK